MVETPNINELDLIDFRIVYPDAMNHFDIFLNGFIRKECIKEPKFELWPFAFQMGFIIEWYQLVFIGGDLSMIQYKDFKSRFEYDLKRIDDALRQLKK